MRDQAATAIEHKDYALPAVLASGLAEDVARLNAAFPDLLPAIPSDILRVRPHHTTETVATEVLLAYLNRALGRLDAEIDEAQASPVTQTKEFQFVTNGSIRTLLERDYEEVQKAYVATCWKATIILAGGAIEAVLLDLLTQHKSLAPAAVAAPKKQPDLNDWGLSSLIAVAVELRLISAGVEKLSHSVREYRNLVHPGNELDSGLTVGHEEARIALEVLNLLHRELSK